MPPPSPDKDELIGQTIVGRYRVISQLGAGGMGTAYRAWDEQQGVPVVIKIPKKELFEDPSFATRFYREIQLLQGLNHPHIVPIKGVGLHESLPFMALRLLPGGSLSNRRLRDEEGRARPNPPGMLHLWLPAVAEALDFAHSQGVVHRDVKLSNIFFDAFWGAFLGDFGIAKVVEESETFNKEHTLTATHMAGIGTPQYMAPEQFTSKAVIDGRADQYALAVVVYEILAGVRPFTGAMPYLIVEVVTQPAPRLDQQAVGLPVSLVEAVHRGLAKRPEHRFGSCGEFAHAVLRDVAPLTDERDVARLLCPNCENILKLPTTAAGQMGRCPRCRATMEVAGDLGALWLLDEAQSHGHAGSVVNSDGLANALEAEADATTQEIDEEALKAFKPVSSTTPSRTERAHRRAYIFKGIPQRRLTRTLLAAAAVLFSWPVIFFSLSPRLFQTSNELFFVGYWSWIVLPGVLVAAWLSHKRVPFDDRAWKLLGIGLGCLIFVPVFAPAGFGLLAAAWIRERILADSLEESGDHS